MLWLSGAYAAWVANAAQKSSSTRQSVTLCVAMSRLAAPLAAARLHDGRCQELPGVAVARVWHGVD